MFSLLAVDRGMQIVMLGANVPLAELPAAAKRGRCGAIVLSATMAPDNHELVNELPTTVKAADVPVFVGGVASLHERDAIVAGGAEAVIRGCPTTGRTLIRPAADLSSIEGRRRCGALQLPLILRRRGRSAAGEDADRTLRLVEVAGRVVAPRVGFEIVRKCLSAQATRGATSRIPQRYPTTQAVVEATDSLPIWSSGRRRIGSDVTFVHRRLDAEM
jgi:hypothetical protein